MDYFPIFVNLQDQHCLVVGAGDIAARKIDLLLRAGAQLTVLAPEVSAQVEDLQQRHPEKLQIQRRIFSDQDLPGHTLVVSATAHDAVNRQVAAAARALNIPVNVVDSRELCSFIFPSIIDRSPVIAAVSTGGAAPVLTRLLRAKLESVIHPRYGNLASLAGKFRSRIKQQIRHPGQRRIFWEQILQGRIAEQVFSGNQESAEQMLEQALQEKNTRPAQGEVYLIGAGPGDPDLLTFRALRLMQQADVIVHDRLVSAEILDLARRDAERIYVGKQRQNHSLPQESINMLLARLAKAGKRVARVKGGDPFIFGRGGEEMETLMEQGIHFQVVPGITAASGCAAYAGIPLTHRDYAQSCTFVTGHLKDGSINLDWKQLAAPNQTIVIYMGLIGLGSICQSLIANGSPADLPAALIQQGTTSKQRIVTGTLGTLPDIVEKQKINPPTLIIIGRVVELRQRLAWFDTDGNTPETITQPA